MSKTYQQHYFDLLYVFHNVFERKKYKYILIGVDVASRCKVERALRTNKANEAAFVLEAIYKNTGVFKYPKVFQCYNKAKFRGDVAMFLEKYNVNIRATTRKY